MSDTTWISSTETKSGIAHLTSLSSIGSLPCRVHADSSCRLHERILLQIAWYVPSQTSCSAKHFMLRRNILRCTQVDHEQTDPRQALAHPDLRRPFDSRQVQRTLSDQSRARSDGPVGCLRSADTDRLRQRS